MPTQRTAAKQRSVEASINGFLPLRSRLSCSMWHLFYNFTLVCSTASALDPENMQTGTVQNWIALSQTPRLSVQKGLKTETLTVRRLSRVLPHPWKATPQGACFPGKSRAPRPWNLLTWNQHTLPCSWHLETFVWTALGSRCQLSVESNRRVGLQWDIMYNSRCDFKKIDEHCNT